jgi:polyisoprenoid-binding protein YceI
MNLISVKINTTLFFAVTAISTVYSMVQAPAQAATPAASPVSASATTSPPTSASANAAGASTGGTGFTQKDGKIEFFAIGKPSMLKIHGASDADQGKIQIATDASGAHSLTGAFAVKLDSFDTGMDMRNKHMKEKTFQIDKYPDAKFTLENVSIPKDSTDKKITAHFTGKLNFHGAEKPIAGDVDVTLHEKTVDYDATFSMKMTDFGCTIPEFAGMTIQDEVKVEAKGTAQK